MCTHKFFKKYVELRHHAMNMVVGLRVKFQGENYTIARSESSFIWKIGETLQGFSKFERCFWFMMEGRVCIQLDLFLLFQKSSKSLLLIKMREHVVLGLCFLNAFSSFSINQEMALSGRLIGYVEINKKGDVFHDLLRHNPNEIAVLSPDKVHGCDLLAGDRGAVGSVILWHFTHDGKRKTDKEIIEAVNEENQTIVFKFIEGEVLEIYKSITIIFHVEQKGDGQVATWAIEFEKPDTSVPYPTAFLDFLCNVVKDMDTHASTK